MTYVARPLDALGVLDADVAGSDDLEDEPVVVNLTNAVGDDWDVGFLEQGGQWSVPYTRNQTRATRCTALYLGECPPSSHGAIFTVYSFLFGRMPP